MSDQKALAQELRVVTAFKDLADDKLEWIASRMEFRDMENGELIAGEGDPATQMFVILKGGIRGQVERNQDDGRTYMAEVGQITGMLPFSRLRQYPLTTRAYGATRLAIFPASDFPALLEQVPELSERLVGVLADRVRDTTRANVQHEKLAALGKLSAGLAHELNNPASAARRSAENLRETVKAMREANMRLQKQELTQEQRLFLAHLECEWSGGHTAQAMDSLERSDREESVVEWLSDHGVPNPWSLAPGLVDAGCCDVAVLNQIGALFQGQTLTDAMTRLTASFTLSKLVEEIENSTVRISELVRAIKDYSYMDQMARQEIDVHTGIDTTLVMLKHRLRNGIEVTREYDRSLPKICAYGSELNQVWTNLIDNAVDAMDGKGKLTIRTAAEPERALVEIRDNGPGIPPDIRDRIFEPFFTTKPVGKGTGIGLDAVYRIVQKHGGKVEVDSKPGDTRFQVRLPITASTERTTE